MGISGVQPHAPNEKEIRLDILLLSGFNTAHTFLKMVYFYRLSLIIFFPIQLVFFAYFDPLLHK